MFVYVLHSGIGVIEVSRYSSFWGVPEVYVEYHYIALHRYASCKAFLTLTLAVDSTSSMEEQQRTSAGGSDWTQDLHRQLVRVLDLLRNVHHNFCVGAFSKLFFVVFSVGFK